MSAKEEERKQAVELERRKRQLIATKQALTDELPHLYGWPWYPWAWDFFESRKKVTLLCAANQISKSSTQIRKCIDWATAQLKWGTLWGRKPNQFWYLYPSKDVATIEFDKKWVPEFLPKGKMKDHPIYGWRAEFDKKYIKAVHFHSGVTVYFKTYAQDPKTLQSGSCYAVFCFTAGHLVETEHGLKKIEEIIIGDRVLTRDGSYQEIQDTYSRAKFVIKRYLTSGEYLEGTPDHRVWTKNRGYVELQSLTSKDVLDISPTWQKKKRKYLRGSTTTDTQRLVIEDTIILQQPIEEKSNIFTKLFGFITVGQSLKGCWSTIRTRTSQIIEFLTWCWFQELSTLGNTRKMSGRQALLVITKRRLACAAIKFLKREPLKKRLVDTVHKDVEKPHTLKLVDVFTAIMNLLLGRTPRNTTVIANVAISPKHRLVYNINVKNVHNYYLSGVNLANCDEELPVHLYDELQFRLAGTQGYFHMVFTATLNQEFWWRVMECAGTDQELLKDAWKRQVSMYDCLYYTDGQGTPWTVDRIREVEGKCRSQAEVMRRVHGRFIKEDGRKYHAFDPSRHYKTACPVPSNWHRYVGIDIGSGGDGGHPSAIVFLAVRPDYKVGYIYKGWRGDGIHTTSGDVYEKFKELLDPGEILTRKFYDYSAVDFGTITSRMGDPFEKANKSHDLGEDIFNTLLKNDMLFIFDTDELRKLGVECLGLLKSTPKTKAKDDFVDAARYATVEIPWDFTHIKGYTEEEKPKVPGLPKTPEEHLEWEIDQRRALFFDPRDKKTQSWEDDFEDELDEWNAMSGN